MYDANFDVFSADLTKAKKQDVDVATAFLARLTVEQKRRISGWYLAREWHNFDDANAQSRLRTYLLDLTNELPPMKEVLVAPFFVIRTDACTTPKDEAGTATMFAALLANTKITRLLLQDGFGARNERECKWGDDVAAYAERAKTYAQRVAAAMPANAYGKKIELGLDLEAFGDVGPDMCRLDLQFAVVPQKARVIVYEHRACCATGLCQ